MVDDGWSSVSAEVEEGVGERGRFGVVVEEGLAMVGFCGRHLLVWRGGGGTRFKGYFETRP